MAKRLVCTLSVSEDGKRSEITLQGVLLNGVHLNESGSFAASIMFGILAVMLQRKGCDLQELIAEAEKGASLGLADQERRRQQM